MNIENALELQRILITSNLSDDSLIRINELIDLIREDERDRARADAIDECIKIVGDNSCMYSCDEDDCVECTIKRIEQLKEQNR